MLVTRGLANGALVTAGLGWDGYAVEVIVETPNFRQEPGGAIGGTAPTRLWRRRKGRFRHLDEQEIIRTLVREDEELIAILVRMTTEAMDGTVS